MFGCCLFRHADAGEGAQQTIQSVGICLTLFGQEANATHLVSKRIGNAETCSRAKHATAGIRHCHFDEPGIRRCYIADATAELSHETPQIPRENIRGTAGDVGERARLRNSYNMASLCLRKTCTRLPLTRKAKALLQALSYLGLQLIGPKDYSYLNATMGSTRMARRAGT